MAWRNANFVIFGLAGFGLSSWVSRLPAVRDSLSASNVQMSVLALAIAAGSISGLLLAGRITNFFPARRLISFALSASSIGLLLAAVGASASVTCFVMVFVGLLLFGLGAGVCNVTMNAEGTVIERTIGAPIMPLFHAAFSIGAVIGASLGVVAILVRASVLMHLLIVAIVVVVGAAISVRSFQSHPLVPNAAASPKSAPPEKIEYTGRVSPWLEGRTLLIGVVVLGASFANGSANDWIALATVDGHKANDSTGAIAFDVFVISVVVARLLGVRLLARYGRVRLLQASALSTAVGILIFVFVPNTVIAIAIGALLWGLGTALGFPIGMSAAGDRLMSSAARISVVAAIGYAGSLAGPPIIGFLSERYGLLDSLLAVLVFVVIAGAVAPVVRRSSTESRQFSC